MSTAPEQAWAPIASNDNTDDVLDVSGAMRLLKLGRHAVYDGVANGTIPHRRIGKHIRFSRQALIRWLDSTQDEHADAGSTRP